MFEFNQWIPEDPDGPLPMSRDYRDKLAVLCDLIKSGSGLSADITPQKDASIRRMCSKLRESRRSQSAGPDLGEPGGGGGIFTALVICAAGYYFFTRAQPRPVAERRGNRPDTRHQSTPGGSGALGGGGNNLTPQELREARLQRFAAASTGGSAGDRGAGGTG
jgi:hypothetical protein